MTEAWAGYSTLDRLWRVRVHMRAWSHPECDDLEPVAREQFTGRSPRNSRRPSIASRLQPHCGDPHSGHEHLLGRGSLGPQRHARDGTVVRVRIEFQRLGIRLGLWKRFIEQQRLVVRLGPVQRIVDVVLRQRIGQREWVEFQRRRNGDVLDRAEGKPPILSDMDRPVRVVLDLEISVSEQRLADLLAFLRRAVPFYEQPGGIRITLLRDDQRPGRYIERVEYVDEAAFALDQLRIAEVEQMKALLAEWRGLLQEPPVVRVYRTIGIA